MKIQHFRLRPSELTNSAYIPRLPGEGRKWTAKEITDTIRYGERSKAVNKVNKGNRAVRYTDRETGKYVVRDEVTKEILQVSHVRFALPK